MSTAEQKNLVLLTTVSNDVERAMVMGLLQGERVLALAKDSAEQSGLRPYLVQQAKSAGISQAEIYVYEKDYERAKEIIDAFQNAPLEMEELE